MSQCGNENSFVLTKFPQKQLHETELHMAPSGAGICCKEQTVARTEGSSPRTPTNCHTEKQRTEMILCFTIQSSLQELGLCLCSINHFMVTGGGPLVSQPTPASWPQGRRLLSSVSTNKKGAACSHSPSSRGHLGLRQTGPFILQHLQDQHPRTQASKAERRRERDCIYVKERPRQKCPLWPPCVRRGDGPGEQCSGDLQVAQRVGPG